MENFGQQGTLVVSFFSVVIFSFVIWLIALVHAATRKNFKDSNSKLIWVLIIIFTHVIGALIYLLFGRPKGEKQETDDKKTSRIGLLFSSFWSMPLGIKFLTLVYLYTVVDTTFNIGRLFGLTYFYQIQLSPPISIVYSLIFYIINILILVALFNRFLWGWKLLLANGIFHLISYIIFRIPLTIKTMLSSPEGLYKIYENFPKNQQPDYYTNVTKFSYISIDIAMLIFSLLVLIYIFKKKNYFSRA